MLSTLVFFGIQLLAVAAAGGHPAAPFVVGNEGRDDQNDGENSEKDLHGFFRIAQTHGFRKSDLSSFATQYASQGREIEAAPDLEPETNASRFGVLIPLKLRRTPLFEGPDAFLVVFAVVNLAAQRLNPLIGLGIQGVSIR